jgi:hypothetical protein
MNQIPINVAVFTPKFQNSAQFPALMAVFQSSPTMVTYLNQLAASGGFIDLGINGNGTSSVEKTITVDPSWLPGSGSPKAEVANVLATTIGHELGHVTQDGGSLSFGTGATNWANAVNPAVAAAVGEKAEGIALLAEYKIATDLGVTMHSGAAIQGTLTQLAAANGGIASQQFQNAAITAGANYTAALTPSISQNLNYGQFYSDQWILNKCGIDTTLIAWKDILPADIMYAVKADGTCSLNGSTIRGTLGTYQINGILNPIGAIQSELEITTPTNGAITANIIGQETVNLNNATITVAPGSSATITGSGLTVNATTGTIKIGGNGQAASNAAIDTVNASGAAITIADNSRVVANDSNGTITGGQNDNFAGYGSGVTINANSTDNVWTGYNTQTAADNAVDIVNAGGAVVTVEGNSRVITNNPGTVNAGANANVGAYGSGININTSPGDGIWVGGNGATGAFDTVNGPGITANVADGSRVNFNGGADIINSGLGNVLNLNGGGYTVTTGFGNHIFATGTLTANGAKPDNITISASNAIGKSVDGQGSGIWLDNNVQANIKNIPWYNGYGSEGEVVYAGTGDSISLNGPGNTVVNGANDHITISGTTPLQGGIEYSRLFGSNTNGGLAADGQAAGVWLDANAGLDLYGDNNRIFTDSPYLFVANKGAPNIITYSSGAIHLATNTSATIKGNNVTVNGGGHNVVNVTGRGDHVIVDNSTITFWDLSGIFTNDTVTGNGDTVNNYTGTFGLSADQLSSQAIILNLAGTPVQTTSLAESQVYVDIEHSGDRVHTAWASAGEGILVRETAASGGIIAGAGETRLVRGFTALAILDSNGDQKIDSSDDAWGQLKVWIDNTGSGTQNAKSLLTLEQLGIASISLDANNINQVHNGNRFLYDATFTGKDGGIGDIASVDLAYDPNAILKSRSAPQATLAASVPTTSGSLNHLIDAMAAFTSGNNGIDTNFSLATGYVNPHLLAASSYGGAQRAFA